MAGLLRIVLSIANVLDFSFEDGEYEVALKMCAAELKMAEEKFSSHHL